MGAFTEAERASLTGGPCLGPIAMAERDGTPHVVPVGRRFHPERDAIDVGAHDLELIRIHPDRVVSWGVANRSWQALPVPRRTGAR